MTTWTTTKRTSTAKSPEGPLLIAGVMGTTFGLWEQVNVLSGVAVLLIAGWEFSLGVYLVVNGFRPSGLARLDTRAVVAGA